MAYLGDFAGSQYRSEGLAVSATPEGARLPCSFQQLTGQVTADGLWLSSTANNASADRFQVKATHIARTPMETPPVWSPPNLFPGNPIALASVGAVTIDGNVARFRRDGLTEEYSVSIDGVRQDFIIQQKPTGEGRLRVELELTGARPEMWVNGAHLILNSGRRLAYNRLLVTDAKGHEFASRMELSGQSEGATPISGMNLAILVEDADAIYPLRIDPTFSDADWHSMGGIPGTDGEVRSAVVDPFGNLYIGGHFSKVGDVAANCVAKWDGNSWSALGPGFDADNWVYALAVSGTNLYAGGLLSSNGIGYGSVAKWDGTAWTRLGSGVESPGVTSVRALATIGSDVYVGGEFRSAGGIPATNIAKWSGAGWSAVGTGLNEAVDALAVIGTDLYAGGYFTAAGGVPANCVARWDGSKWNALGAGVKSSVTPWVHSLAVSGKTLYVGGRFSNAGGVAAANIARWNGSAWSALGSGLSGRTFAILISGTDVYAGHDGSSPASYLARWNGSSWAAVGSGVNGNVYALAKAGTSVFVGGAFTGTGESASRYLAIWNGSKWSAPGSGISSQVNALVGSDTNLYAGGRFVTAGGATAFRIARWNGLAWSPLGSGLTGPNPEVYALALRSNHLYVGGFFTNAGGIAATNIARWDGTNWSAVGSGLGRRQEGAVYALALSGNDLYAGGSFTNAGNTSANRIAWWNGTNWSALGSGLSRLLSPTIGSVNGLALWGDNLYAGGSFDRAGGNLATNIARWDGTEWHELSNGLNNVVDAMLVVGEDLYVGGSFTQADETAVPSRVARWDGALWHSVGSAIDLDSYGVSALAFSGGHLYAGGTFNDFFSLSPNRIARWDGNSWSALGSGLDASVSALLVSGGNLYVGGSFTKAGSIVSSRIARASIGIAQGRFANPAYSPAAGFAVNFLDASVGQPYRIQTSPSLASGTWTDYSNFVYSVPVPIAAPAGTTSTSRFFRAVTQ